MARTACLTPFTRGADDRRRRGFTLTELIVSTTISGFILAGVLAAFLMLGRTGANIRNYTEVEEKARGALERFSREARLAYQVNAASATSVTLSIPDATAIRDQLGYKVTYTLDTVNKRFTRTVENPPGTMQPADILIRDVEPIPGLNAFNYYKYVNPTTYPTGGGYFDGFTTNVAASLPEVKQIEINFVLKRKAVTVTEATNKVLSARFILRNK